jgi:UDP-glucuronate 4-epimerase
MKVLVTGVAGFIGYHVAGRLLAGGATVAGLDNLSPYYDVGLKRARLADLEARYGFEAAVIDIADRAAFEAFAVAAAPEVVIHFAAQAGVRAGLTDPGAYVASNLVGFANLLEICRRLRPAHLLYASSSSVYGANPRQPLREADAADRPLSLYAATKLANEALAHSYSHLFAIPATALRFFTVYGEWGRPDMAFFTFARALRERRPVKVFNHGRMARDFTYIGDAVEAVARLIDRPPPGDGVDPHRMVNIASGRRVPLLELITALEKALGCKARLEFEEMQPGDVPETWADTDLLQKLTGFEPKVSVSEGIDRFARWLSTYEPTPQRGEGRVRGR